MKLLFGRFHFDAGTRELATATGTVHLTPKAFCLLELLLLQRPRAISKQAIQDALWPDAFIEEGNVASLVAEVRAALDDDARQPRFLRTVYGYGYAFSGKVRTLDETTSDPTDAPPAGRWSLLLEGREIVLGEGENIVGRDPDVAVWIASSRASRHHARITVTGAKVVLDDLTSKNGTFLNGCPVQGPQQLHHGDHIQIAQVVMILRSLEAKRSTLTWKTAQRSGQS